MNINSIVAIVRDTRRSTRSRILLTVVLAALLWGIAALCIHFQTSRSTCSLLLVLTLLGIATMGDASIALLSSVAAILALSRFSVDKALPLNTVEGIVTMSAMALTAFTGSQMAVRAQRRAEEAERRREEMEKLNRFGGYLFGTNTVSEAAAQIVAGLHDVFGLGGARLSLEDSAHSWGEGEVEGPPVSVVPVPVGGCTFEIYGTRLSDEVLHLLYGMIAQVIVRARNSEEKSRLEAEQKGETLRSTVLNALAHSFRTPLTSIKMAASMLRSDDFVSVADQKDLIAAIDEEASRLDQLIGESLDLARLEYRQSNPRREMCSVSAITGRVIARMNRHFGRREVVVEVPEDLPPIMGDPFLFEQMLIQVVDNAWKYSRPGSQIRISAEAAGASIRISVRNQGSEILPGEQARIFDKFYRGSEFQSTVEGTGLGLAIAKTIAEACHGRIWLESEPSGPAFHFALPVGAQ